MWGRVGRGGVGFEVGWDGVGFLRNSHFLREKSIFKDRKQFVERKNRLLSANWLLLRRFGENFR